MSIIVKHRRTGNQYIFLGIEGQGEKNNSPGRFLSDLFTQAESELATTLVLVCDVAGRIFVADIDDLTVIEIDGQKPEEILPAPTVTAVEPEQTSSATADSESEATGDWQKSDRSEFPNPDIKDDFDDFEEDEDWV